jgi:hypothetical protein
MTEKEYSEYNYKRSAIISRNRSNRLKHLPLLEVPAKIFPPKIMVAYEKDGTYAGVLSDISELPDGCHVKFEKAKW